MLHRKREPGSYFVENSVFIHRRRVLTAPDVRTLFAAVDNGHEEEVREHLECGVDPNGHRRRDLDLETPLSQAVIAGNVVIVKLLLESDASLLTTVESDPIRRSHAGRSNLLYRALHGRYHEVADTLLDHRNALWLLMEYLTLPICYSCTSREQNCCMLKSVLKSRCEIDIHFRDYDHTVKTPLTLAIVRGDVEMAKILCRYGASVNKSMYSGRVFTPLMTATYRAVGAPRRELIAYLLEHGARTNAQTEKGNTALHMAVHKRCCYDSLLLLLQHGADVSLKDHKKRNACHTALSRIYFPAVRLLLEAGVVTDFYLTPDALPQLPEPFITWIMHFVSNPRTLKEVSAKRVRSILGENLRRGVDRLPVPDPIKGYLLFTHLDCLKPLFGTGKDSTELAAYAWLVP